MCTHIADYTETGGDDVDEESFQVFDENGELKNINDVNWNTDTKSDSLTNSLKGKFYNSINGNRLNHFYSNSLESEMLCSCPKTAVSFSVL